MTTPASTAAQSAHPSGLFGKFSHYRHKYGTFGAALSFVGRKRHGLWKRFGPMATRGYVKRWLAARPNPADRTLNLGGGSNCMPDCLTVDIDARADAYVDITRLLPFEDRSFGAVFCEEVIEHIDLNAGLQLLREISRILIPGGVVRLITPNLAYFAQRFMASQAATDEINSIFYSHDHRHIFSIEELTREMHNVGLTDVLVSSFRDPASKLGRLDSHPLRFNHPPEISQYLEARKPA